MTWREAAEVVLTGSTRLTGFWKKAFEVRLWHGKYGTAG
jgi:hypothetical protein